MLFSRWQIGGKVERFGLKARADERGVVTVFLDKRLDLAELARPQGLLPVRTRLDARRGPSRTSSMAGTSDDGP
jgi:hypothetical protein